MVAGRREATPFFSWLPSLTQAISSLHKIKERKTRKAKSVGYKKVKFKTATQLSEVKA